MVDDVSAPEGTREGPDDATNKGEFVKLWLDAIAIASEDEQPWREREATDCLSIYRQGDARTRYADDKFRDTERRFNILHANVETIVPALYNSTPEPDVRRRFGDKDETAKQVADIIERALSYSVDTYDFDSAMRASVYDMEITGRGVDRVRYVPYLDETEDQIAYEEVTCEHIPWRHFRRGPSRMWADVPWIAFELFLTRDELAKLAPDLAEDVALDCEIEQADKRDGDNPPEVYKRARVWEIWDKDTRKTVWIATGYREAPLREEDDPLGLTGFFPIPRPLYAIETSDTLIPVTPYSIYKDQAEELERVSRRIMSLVEEVKVCGAYDGAMDEIAQLKDKGDGDMVPVKNVANYATSGSKGLENGIAWWPIEPAIAALKQLYEQREQIKQTIYEITGIADIMRGQTDANETLGAQQLKTQWGSLRVQRKQAEIQRYCRDLFRLKAEIIASKFQWQTIVMMTGVKLPSAQDKQMAQQIAQQAQQAGKPVPEPVAKVLGEPAAEEVEQLLRSDAMRGYRVDVESDSTIRADMTRNQQNMNLFLQGTAQFVSALGPFIQDTPEAKPIAIEIYTAFARNFKLGKQAEDALDALADAAKQTSQKPPKPSPEELKLQGQMQLEQQKLEFQKASAEQQFRLDSAKLEAELRMEQMKLEAQIALEREKASVQMQLEREKADQDLTLRREEMANDIQFKTDNSTREIEFKDRAQKRELAAQGISERIGESGEPDMMTAIEAANDRSNKVAEQGMAMTQQMLGQVAEAIQKMAEASQAQAKAAEAQAQAANAPRRVVWGPDGKVSHSVPTSYLRKEGEDGKPVQSEIAQFTEAVNKLADMQAAPRRVVRGADGKISHSELTPVPAHLRKAGKAGAADESEIAAFTKAVNKLVTVQSADRKIVRGPDGKITHSEVAH